jgi:hypothetical protein
MLAKLVTFQKGPKTPASKLTPSQQKDWDDEQFNDMISTRRIV